MAWLTRIYLAGCRTPIGKFMGTLASVPATALGGLVVARGAPAGPAPGRRGGRSHHGQRAVGRLGQAPARQAALRAGLPPTVAAVTINKVCGSGLKAVMLADQAIRAGDAELIVAGGMESMSRAPVSAPGCSAGLEVRRSEGDRLDAARRAVVRLRGRGDGEPRPTTSRPAAA